MIDIHCHILPNVDDGPESYQDALMMVDMAYEDGVKCVIATPHRNHPFEFMPKESIETTYKTLRAEIQKRYTDFGIVLGAELYIDKDYHKILSEKPYPFTIGETNYVLIEFPHSIKHQDIHEVVHEFIIKGYRPIIAHIEMYKCLNGHIERVRSIRNEGAYIQVTGSSVIGKQGKDTAQFLRKIIRGGLVDFVASDGHRYNRRRPLLKSAYKTVASILSTKEAERIFEENPKLLIAGKHIPQPTYALKTGNSMVLKLNLIAASFAVIALSAAGVIALLSRNEAVVGELTSGKQMVEAIKTIEEIESSSGEENATIEADVASSAQSTSGSPMEVVTEIVPSKESIESKYHEALLMLKSDYISSLDEIVSNIKVARSNISNETQRKQIIDAYIEEIVSLEQNSDNTVFDLLYKMQNELEKYRYDISKVQVMRDEYHLTKAEKQNEYIRGLGVGE